MQNWYSEGRLLSMMVSFRFQLILFLLCAAYKKGQCQLIEIYKVLFSSLGLSKSKSFSKGYWNPDRKLGVHVAIHFCRGNVGSVMY